MPNPQGDTEPKKPVNLKQLYPQLQDDWEIYDFDMMNSEPLNQFNVYLLGIQSFIQSNRDLNYKIDLQQNRDVKKLKITISTLHQQNQYLQRHMENSSKLKKVQRIGETLHIIQHKQNGQQFQSINNIYDEDELEDYNFVNQDSILGKQEQQDVMVEDQNHYDISLYRYAHSNTSEGMRHDNTIQQSLIQDNQSSHKVGGRRIKQRQPKQSMKIEENSQILMDHSYEEQINDWRNKYQELEEKIQTLILENKASQIQDAFISHQLPNKVLDKSKTQKIYNAPAQHFNHVNLNYRPNFADQYHYQQFSQSINDRKMTNESTVDGQQSVRDQIIIKQSKYNQQKPSPQIHKHSKQPSVLNDIFVVKMGGDPFQLNNSKSHMPNININDERLIGSRQTQLQPQKNERVVYHNPINFDYNDQNLSRLPKSLNNSNKRIKILRNKNKVQRANDQFYFNQNQTIVYGGNQSGLNLNPDKQSLSLMQINNNSAVQSPLNMKQTSKNYYFHQKYHSELQNQFSSNESSFQRITPEILVDKGFVGGGIRNIKLSNMKDSKKLQQKIQEQLKPSQKHMIMMSKKRKLFDQDEWLYKNIKNLMFKSKNSIDENDVISNNVGGNIPSNNNSNISNNQLLPNVNQRF
ncbi:UNKNOWN [Stylonychia lemnae]|uniref:Uncharacterized protein n=1 Tax=Stylonychia lemnae TaxID=5949 RepID=A0A077ZSK2_STYLE|nr:UNKNOWN [Stylonychia lemnae]|eukprot:CDW72842.1 UNKNOWN [Stylonychia lemnae]